MRLMDARSHTRSSTTAHPIALLGVPFDNVSTAETIQRIEQMVLSRRPHYIATANVDFLVQALHDIELRRILLEAHMVLCDGTPLLWASKLLGNPLPERVAGADLVPLLIEDAAEKNYRIFFLGGAPESAERAIRNLRTKYPRLIIAGHYSPPFCNLLEMDHDDIKRRIFEAKPDLLFVSFGCPKQEKWIAMHYRSLGVPVVIGVGGTIDFLAGTTRRAPKWMQEVGMEWIFRLIQEPRRLFGRYASDLWWFSRAILGQWWLLRGKRRKATSAEPLERERESSPCWHRIRFSKRLDLQTVRHDALVCEEALANSPCCLLEMDDVGFIDSTGMGLLIRLQKKARIAGRQFILIAPAPAVISALKLMRLLDFFTIARDMQEAEKIITDHAEKSVVIQTNYFPSKPALYWRGEVTAANAEEVWQMTSNYLTAHAKPNDDVLVDLSCLQFIDSTGVGLMIRARKNAMSRGVNLHFVGTQPNVRDVLRLAKLESVLLGKAA